MAQFFRSDGWVKTTLGPAVTNALIYVCTQPTTDITDIPPVPLAQLYADPLGQNTLPQPVATDGFGHYDFYIATGTYTVVVVYNGKVQQVYADQSIGGAGAGAFTLNGLSGNVSIAAGTNISIAVVGSSILISGQAGGVTSLNALTGALSIAAGSGVGVSAVGSTITVSNTNQPATFNTGGQAYFVGPGLNGSALINNFQAQITNFPAHTVVVEQFVLQSSWTLSACTYTVMTGGSGTFNHGIYNASGSKLIDCNFNGTITTTQTIAISPAVTLPPGTYYFASSCSVAAGSSPLGPHSQWTAGEIVANLQSINAGSRTVIATAANAESGGVLPATLGTLTAITSSINYQGSAIPFWQV